MKDRRGNEAPFLPDTTPSGGSGEETTAQVSTTSEATTHVVTDAASATPDPAPSTTATVSAATSVIVEPSTLEPTTAVSKTVVVTNAVSGTPDPAPSTAATGTDAPITTVPTTVASTTVAPKTDAPTTIAATTADITIEEIPESTNPPEYVIVLDETGSMQQLGGKRARNGREIIIKKFNKFLSLLKQKINNGEIVDGKFTFVTFNRKAKYVNFDSLLEMPSLTRESYSAFKTFGPAPKFGHI